MRNVVRIITETGLRVYKELVSMKKDHVDLENKVVWIPDSKTPNGVAEVPLTDLAVSALRVQMQLAGKSAYLFPTESAVGHQTTFKTAWRLNAAAREGAVLSHLRSALDLRDAPERRRRRRRMGDAAPPPGRREGVQEVLADEIADETRRTGAAQSGGEREEGSATARGFCDSSATVGVQERNKRNCGAVGNCSKIRVTQSRGVAQPGSAPALGAGGRWFESSRPDHF